MLRFVCVASAFLALSTTASEARPSRVLSQAPECNVTMPCDFSISKTGRDQVISYAQRLERRIHSQRGRVDLSRGEVSRVDVASTEIITGRPAGCPSLIRGRWA